MSHDSSNVVVELVSEEPWLRDPNAAADAEGAGVQPAGVQVFSDEADYSDDQDAHRDAMAVMPSDASSTVEQQSMPVSDESDVDAAELARHDATAEGASAPAEPPALVDEAAKLSVGSAESGSNNTSPSASFIADSASLSTGSSTSEEEGKDASAKDAAKLGDKILALVKADANRSQRSSIGSASISSGKSRVVPAGAEKWSLNRFSDDLLDRIIAPLGFREAPSARTASPYMPGGPLPAGLRVSGRKDSVEWFNFWRWRKWFVSLRLLSKKWDRAITHSHVWALLLAMFAPDIDTGRAGGALFKPAQAVLRLMCAPCGISGNSAYRSPAAGTRPTFLLGGVPMCQQHRREKPSNSNVFSPMYICWNCFQPDSQDACVLLNEDWGSFDVLSNKHSGNTCRHCREAALDAEIREKWGLEGYTSKLNNGISATYAAEAYIDEAEGEAGEIAKLLAQDHWLRTYTPFSNTETQVLQNRKVQRMAALKELQRKALKDRQNFKYWATQPDGAAAVDVLAQIDLEEEEEYGDDALHEAYKSMWGRDENAEWEDDTFLTQEESNSVESFCLRQWLQYHFDSGVWQSPAEGYHKRLPTGNIQSVSGLPIIPTFPEDDNWGSGQPITIIEKSPFSLAEHGITLYQQPVPPPGSLALEAENLWLDRVVEPTLRNPLNNIIAWIKSHSDDPDAVARTFDLQRLLGCLRHRPFWQPRKMKIKPKLGGKQASASYKVPYVPASSVDVGHWTAQRIMTVWEQVQAPLRECACSICMRSKRKREETMQDLLTPEELYIDELDPNSSELSSDEWSETEYEEEETKSHLASKADLTGGRLVKAPRI